VGQNWTPVVGQFSMPIDTSVQKLFPARIAGTGLGLINLFPFAGGAFLHPLLGSILENYGTSGSGFTIKRYRQAFFLLFLSAIGALIASFFIKETYQQDLSAASIAKLRGRPLNG